MPKAKAPSPSEIFCERLKAARFAAGLSQKSLGILAGIDEFVASTRINRYELGVHEADLATAKRLADALQVPLAYLYAENVDLAEVIQLYSQLKPAQRHQIHAAMGEMLQDEDGGSTYD
jgi:transcriptional regulator with XRE-family HTH domain